MICNIFVWVLITHPNPFSVIVFHVAWGLQFCYGDWSPFVAIL
jgi:hypothetical protein